LVAEDRARHGARLEVLPLGVAFGEWIGALAIGDPPFSEEKVEILAAVVGVGRLESDFWTHWLSPI